MAGVKARLPPRWLIVTFWHAHRLILRASSGRKGLWRPRPGKWGALRLTTRGRRSGEPRSVIVGYYKEGSNLITMAMNGWGAAEPSWWLNLQAHPEAVVELAGGIRGEVLGRAAVGGSVNGCGSAGANWTKSSTPTLHDVRTRRRSSSSSRVLAERLSDFQPGPQHEWAGVAQLPQHQGSDRAAKEDTGIRQHLLTTEIQYQL
jgi:deazaflavin-dependent oxidoreductase (nitroreductase family)